MCVGICVCVCVCVDSHLLCECSILQYILLKNIFVAYTDYHFLSFFFPFVLFIECHINSEIKFHAFMSWPWRYKLYTINFSERCYLNNKKKMCENKHNSHKNVGGKCACFTFLNLVFVIKLLHAILTEQFTKYTLKNDMISKSCFSITLQFF